MGHSGQRREDNRASCGEGEFLLAACNRLQELGASISAISHQIEAFEIHDASADQALRRLKSSGFSCGIKVGNYLELPSTDLYDVVIGNPPYVRFQAVDGKQKALSREIADRNKVSFSGLSSLWVSFVLNLVRGCVRVAGWHLSCLQSFCRSIMHRLFAHSLWILFRKFRS